MNKSDSPRMSKDSTSSAKRIAELEAEVDRLQGELAKSRASFGPKVINFFRSFAIIILVIVTALFLNFSIAAIWVKRNVVNTDVWVAKTTEFIQTESVRNDIANRVSTEIFAQADVEQTLAGVLPPKVEGLAAPLTKTLQDKTTVQIEKIMQSPQFIQMWQNANRSAHAGIIQSLEAAGDPSVAVPTDNLMYIQNDTLLLNLRPVIDAVKTKLVDSGLGFVGKINVVKSGPTVQVTKIENMQTVLMAFNLINKTAALMPILALVSAFGALLLARRKRVVLMAIGLTTALLMVLNVQAIFLARYPVVQAAASSLTAASSQSATAVFDILTSDLILLDRVLMGVVLLVTLGAFLGGQSKAALWLRTATARLFSGKQNNQTIRWLGKHATQVVGTIGVIAALLIVFPFVKGPVFPLVIVSIVVVVSFFLLSLKTGYDNEQKKLTK